MRAPRHGDTQATSEEFDADAKALGLSAEIVASVKQSMTERQGGDSYGVWPVTARAMERLMACGTQWRVASVGMGGVVYLGLDYGASKVALDGLGLKMTPDDWRDFRIAEAAAAGTLNESKESGA